MFIGHFAVGLAAKRVAPRLSLPVLFATVVFADILWPVLVATGVEVVRIVPGYTASTPLEFVSYPWSHSLLMLCVWGALLGGVYMAASGSLRSAVVVAALVVSHWVLDWITHRPDMPLYPGGPKYGLGLWNSVAGTIAVEVLMFAVGVAIYVRATRARDRSGRWGFWGLVAFFIAGFVLNSGGAPPSVAALWISAIVATLLTLLWAAWVDRHRTNTNAGAAKSRRGH